MKPIICAHRGLHSQPAHGSHVENTLSAMLAGWEAGFTYCEIDIRGSLEHEPFLMHDATLDRTNQGHGPIDRTPATELRKIGVTSFAELLKAMPAGKKLFIEIKPAVSAEVIRRTMEAVDPSMCMVQSFDVEVLAEAKKVREDIQLVELTDNAAKARFVVGGVNVLYKTLDAKTVADWRARGLWVGAWTPNEDADIQRMLALDLDAITSDDPLRVRDIAGKIG